MRARDRRQDGGPAGRIPVDPDRRPAVHADGENQQRTQLDQREAGLQPDQLADRRDRLVAARWIAQRRETRVPADIPTGEPGPGVVVGEEDVHISVVGALVTPGQQERPVEQHHQHQRDQQQPMSGHESVRRCGRFRRLDPVFVGRALQHGGHRNAGHTGNAESLFLTPVDMRRAAPTGRPLGAAVSGALAAGRGIAGGRLDSAPPRTERIPRAVPARTVSQIRTRRAAGPGRRPAGGDRCPGWPAPARSAPPPSR